MAGQRFADVGQRVAGPVQVGNEAVLVSSRKRHGGDAGACKPRTVKVSRVPGALLDVRKTAIVRRDVHSSLDQCIAIDDAGEAAGFGDDRRRAGPEVVEVKQKRWALINGTHPFIEECARTLEVGLFGSGENDVDFPAGRRLGPKPRRGGGRPPPHRWRCLQRRW